MFSTVSSGMGATVCTAGRFLLVAPFTKLEDEAEEDEAESVAPVRHQNYINLELNNLDMWHSNRTCMVIRYIQDSTAPVAHVFTQITLRFSYSGKI